MRLHVIVLSQFEVLLRLTIALRCLAHMRKLLSKTMMQKAQKTMILVHLSTQQILTERPSNATYEPFQFVGDIPGPLKPVLNCLEAFELFLTGNIIDITVEETNRN